MQNDGNSSLTRSLRNEIDPTRVFNAGRPQAAVYVDNDASLRSWLHHVRRDVYDASFLRVSDLFDITSIHFLALVLLVTDFGEFDLVQVGVSFAPRNVIAKAQRLGRVK